MYVHLSEKLTLDMLSRLFYCSPSSISAYLTKAPAYPFSTCSTRCASEKPPIIFYTRT